MFAETPAPGWAKTGVDHETLIECAFLLRPFWEWILAQDGETGSFHPKDGSFAWRLWVFQVAQEFQRRHPGGADYWQEHSGYLKEITQFCGEAAAASRAKSERLKYPCFAVPAAAKAG